MNPIELRNILFKNGLEVSDEQLNLLEKYVSLLKEKNQYINLISRKDIENIWEKHILHSLSLSFYFKLPKDIRILDLGTGAGLPGIPIKIINPHIQIDLVDSIQKKTVAVEEFIKILKLKNINVICQRAEKLKKKYDLILSRAVTELDELYRWSANLFDTARNYSIINKITNETIQTPLLISYKGGKLDNEIKKLKLYSLNLKVDVLDISIEGINKDLLTDKKIIIVKIK